MKTLALSILLLVGVTLSGCLDIAQHYILRADGSLTVQSDIRIDQSLLGMLAGFQHMGDSTKSEAQISKELIDTLRDAFGGTNIAHYRSLPQVLSATSWDSLEDSTIHFRNTVTLRSYKDLYVVAQDTLPGTGSMLPRDSAIFVESGDSLYFQIIDRDTSKEVANIIPPIETKTKKKSSKSHKKQKAVVDTTAQSMDAFTQAMANIFRFEISVESPLLLGADTSAVIDRNKQMATWSINAGSADKLKHAAPMRAWFRKP